MEPKKGVEVEVEGRAKNFNTTGYHYPTCSKLILSPHLPIPLALCCQTGTLPFLTAAAAADVDVRLVAAVGCDVAALLHSQQGHVYSL